MNSWHFMLPEAPPLHAVDSLSSIPPAEIGLQILKTY